VVYRFVLAHLQKATNVFNGKGLLYFLGGVFQVFEAKPLWALIHKNTELFIRFKYNLIFFLLGIFHYEVCKQFTISYFKDNMITGVVLFAHIS